MVGIILIHIAESVRSAWADLHEGIGSFVGGIAFSVLGLFFAVTWLANIGEVSGKRMVFGKVVGRKHYDGFIVALFVLDLLILTGLHTRFIPGLLLPVVVLGLLGWGAHITRTPEVDEGSMA